MVVSKTKKLMFKDLRIGEKFMFASQYSERRSDKYIKISARTYQFGPEQYSRELKNAKEIARIYEYKPPAKLPAQRIGSVTAEVKRGW